MSSKTFYKRVLPASCTAFSSKKGRQLFASALHHGGLKSFFSLMEQHTTQAEPAYCGMATLVVALNAFAVDPKQSWKGPWRWYHDEMLNCCLDLEEVKKSGMSMPDFVCLAICQGLSVDVRYAETEQGSIEEFRAAVRKACVDENVFDSSSQQGSMADDNDQVRDILIVSYDRGTLGQTGSGHFSPVAAFDAQSDSVLILDTARFKYGAHWVPLPLLYSAFLPHDSTTKKSRGFAILSNRQDEDLHPASLEDRLALQSPSETMPVSILFQYKYSLQARTLQEEYSNFLMTKQKGTQRNISWEDVLRFWTKNGTDASYIWQILEPQFKPLNNEASALVEQVMHLMEQLMDQKEDCLATIKLVMNESPAVDRNCTSGGQCRPNHSRTLPLRPEEAIFIVYLASLDSQERRELIESLAPNALEVAKDQLMASTSLVETVVALAGGK